MKVDIYIREINGNREIRIPWLPDEINFDTGEASMASYDILNKGEVSIPTGVSPSEYYWDSIFPGENRTDKSMMRGDWKNPDTYHKILTDWKEKRTKLNLLVIGYPINKTVYITSYNGKASGGFGDIEYSVSFKEARSITITSKNVVVKHTPITVNRPSTETESESPVYTIKEGQTYTVKEGDTLWDIAEKTLGSGGKWKTIYKLNMMIIENTAKLHWAAVGLNRGSQNGRWIFPGTKLRLVQ